MRLLNRIGLPERIFSFKINNQMGHAIPFQGKLFKTYLGLLFWDSFTLELIYKPYNIIALIHDHIVFWSSHNM
jgi:hypothetical protein